MKPAKCDNQAYFFFKQRRYAFFRIDKIYINLKLTIMTDAEYEEAKEWHEYYFGKNWNPYKRGALSEHSKY